MAYINIETEREDYRLVLGSHIRTANPKQLPSNFTAIAIEGIYPHQDYFYSDMMDRSNPYNGYTTRQFSKAIDKAKEFGVPIVAADPIANVQTFSNMINSEEELVKSVFSKRGFTFKSLLAATMLDFMSREITPSSRLYKAAINYSYALSSAGFSIVEFRNLTMAQRASAFAQHQIAHGIERPNIIIGCGALHIGIKDTLEMDPKERIRRIKSHPAYQKYFTTRELRRISFAQYVPSKSIWVKSQITDSFESR